MAPVSLWGLGEATGNVAADVAGGHSGTYNGTVTYNAADIPVDINDGADRDQRRRRQCPDPHHPDLATAAVTISGWIRPHALPTAGEGESPAAYKTQAAPTNANLMIFATPASEGVACPVRIRDDKQTSRRKSASSRLASHRILHAGRQHRVRSCWWYQGKTRVNGWAGRQYCGDPTRGCSQFHRRRQRGPGQIAWFDRSISPAEVFEPGPAVWSRADGLPMTPSQFPRMVPTNIQVLDNDTYVGTPHPDHRSDGGRAVANGPRRHIHCALRGGRPGAQPYVSHRRRERDEQHRDR